MKIRNGFISNSSSSSFMIDKGMTTAQVAILMMYETIDWYMGGDEDDTKSNETIQKQLKAVKWLAENKNYDEPIMIPWTCNYETFIQRCIDSNNIYVSTCNNQDWNILGEVEYIDEDYNPEDPTNTNYISYDKQKTKYLNLRDLNKTTKKQFFDKLYKR